MFLRQPYKLFFLVLLLTACSFGSAPTQTSNDKPVIKLVVNPWVGAEVNVEVARYIIEKELGYPTEGVALDGGAQWDALASGEVHASLEVWPSARAEIRDQHLLVDKDVLRGTELGVIGKNGWYIPTYMLEDHPELATWEAFTNPEIAALFDTEQTTDNKGQFSGGDPDWGHYENEMVKNLGLHMEVVFTDDEQDSEAPLIAQLDEAYEAQKPMVFYFWTPHWAYIVYDLREVEFPPYSDECYAVPDEIDCAYPTDVLFKIYWTGLPEYAPDVYQFLENFNYTNQDQIAMLAMVQLEGKTAREAAETWVNEHEDVWRTWLPKS